MATPMTETDLTAILKAEGELVTERLDHWARETPDKVFFYYGEDDIALSYGDFARQTDAIAGNLARLGIGPGDRVSVQTTNMLASALMMFGIWKAGAVYSPVNFAFGGRLLSYQLDDTRPKLVVTDPQLLPRLNEVAATLEVAPMVTVYLPPAGRHDHHPAPARPDARFATLDWAELTSPAPAPRVEIGFADPANLIYTSGTTGPAKGVIQPHRWMVNYTFGLRAMLGPDDVIYNDLPMYHVGGAIANVGRAAWVGCEVAVWNRFSPNEFWERIARRGATAAILLDVMIPWLTKAPVADTDRANSLNKVHMQPLSLQHNEFARRFGIDFVSVGFGQTESGQVAWCLLEETAEGEGTPAEFYKGMSHAEMHAMAARVGMDVIPGTAATRKGLMGQPSTFVEVAIRDENDELCPPETAGQLTLRPRLPGILMQEYFGKPEATVKAFKNLWFHTGDAAVMGADGMLYYVDRMGDRIRVRGENLSSFQVEDMLNQHPQVQMVAAFSVRGAEGDEDDVAAFVVPREAEGQAPLTEEMLRAFASETMPKYMRPAHIRIVEDLPRTPTNKIEKYKLRRRLLEELGREA